MKECSKSINRRMSNPDFINKYFVGNGVDIGGLPDPLAIYMEFFCQLESVKTWDLEDGDAQFMESVENNKYNFVHSSHCLEHINDPFEGIKNWVRITKPGGYIIVTVPDEDLYEQGIWPPSFNLDHKNTFTIYKRESWCKNSINIMDLVMSLGDEVEVVKIEQLSSNYRFNIPRYDQTLTPVSECGIEFVLRKRPTEEIQLKGRLRKDVPQPSKELKIHLNQYKNDMKNMKTSNNSFRPFEDDRDIE